MGFVVDAKAEGLEPLAAELDAPDVVAAMRVIEQPSEALELVIADPERHQRVHEELPIRTATDAAVRGFVATRAIELLRALRLQVPHENPVQIAAPVPARPPPPLRALMPERPRPTTAILLAPLLSYVPRLGLGASVELQASYSARQLGFDAGIVVPLSAQRLEHVGGDVSAAAAAVYGAFVVQNQLRPELALRFGLGFEVNRVRFEGHAPPPYVNVGATALTYGPRLELTAAVRVAPHLRLLAPFAISYVRPRTVIRFAGETLDEWGPVLLRVGMGAEACWP